MADSPPPDESRASHLPVDIHLIYLRSGPVIIERRTDDDWRAIQDEYPDYMTSLGPWTMTEVVEFLLDDWPEHDLNAAVDRLRTFDQSGAIRATLTGHELPQRASDQPSAGAEDSTPIPGGTGRTSESARSATPASSDNGRSRLARFRRQ